MANHVSSLKRARQTEVKTAVNRANKSKLRSALRGLREAIVAGDKNTLKAAYGAAVSVLDKSVQKGVIRRGYDHRPHLRNTASYRVCDGARSAGTAFRRIAPLSAGPLAATHDPRPFCGRARVSAAVKR